MLEFENCENKTDEELVALILENQRYFLCLMNRYQDKLLRYIMRISGVRREDAEDLLQEVYIKVYRNLNDFDESFKFSSWIYRITHNQVISEFRKKQARPQQFLSELSDAIIENFASDLNLEREVNLVFNKEIVAKVLSSLKDEYQEIIILRFFEDKDYKEISDILKKPMGTVATLINRAKKQFQEEFLKQDIKL